MHATEVLLAALVLATISYVNATPSCVIASQVPSSSHHSQNVTFISSVDLGSSTITPLASIATNYSGAGRFVSFIANGTRVVIVNPVAASTRPRQSPLVAQVFTVSGELVESIVLLDASIMSTKSARDMVVLGDGSWCFIIGETLEGVSQSFVLCNTTGYGWMSPLRGENTTFAPNDATSLSVGPNSHEVVVMVVSFSMYDSSSAMIEGVRFLTINAKTCEVTPGAVLNLYLRQPTAYLYTYPNGSAVILTVCLNLNPIIHTGGTKGAAFAPEAVAPPRREQGRGTRVIEVAEDDQRAFAAPDSADSAADTPLSAALRGAPTRNSRRSGSSSSVGSSGTTQSSSSSSSSPSPSGASSTQGKSSSSSDGSSSGWGSSSSGAMNHHGPYVTMETYTMLNLTDEHGLVHDESNYMRIHNFYSVVDVVNDGTSFYVLSTNPGRQGGAAGGFAITRIVNAIPFHHEPTHKNYGPFLARDLTRDAALVVEPFAVWCNE